MGIKDWFKKVGSKIIGGISRVGSFVKDKILPVASRIAKPALGIISKLPGTIGKIGKIGSNILGAVGNIAGQIPNKDIGQRIQDGANRIDAVAKPYIGRLQDRAEQLNQTIEDYKKAGGNAWGIIRDAYGNIKKQFNS